MDGVTIGQYRVTGMIGQGGMGIVYAGEHTLLGRSAAIKVLLPELSQKQDAVMRFFNEARAATAIRHPGIVEIYDFGWTPEGAAFIVMEQLEGETLARRSSRARFRWQSALAIARQIAGALSAAHAKGIVHRDLKPDNIFLVTDPEVPGGERIKLLDFGIAKLAGESSGVTPNVTKTGAVMGTPTYMAPEQCRGVAIDHRADLYALGCIVFELCSGRPPFVGEGTGDVLAAHIHVPVPTFATLGTEVPAPVEQLIRHLLVKSPAQRIQSAEELIRAIDAIATERAHSLSEPSGTGHPMPTTPMVTTLSGAASTSRRMPGFSTRRARVLTIAAAVAVTVASFVIVEALRGRGDDARVVSYATLVHPAATPAPVASNTASTDPVATAAPSMPPAAPSPPQVEPTGPAAEPPPLEPPVREAPRPPPQRIDVTVESVPPGAQVIHAGTVLGKTPFHGTLPRRSGDPALLVRLAGYLDRSVVAHAGQPISVKLVKAPPPPPPRPPRGDRDQSVNPFRN